MKIASCSIAVLSLLFATTVIGAEEGEASAEAEAAPKALTGDVRFGFENTSGNTDTSSLGGEVNLKYIRDIWEFSGRLSGSGREDNNVSSEEQYHAEAKAQRFFREKDYLYGELLYDHDRFAGVTQQTYETIGYGRRIIQSPTQELNLEVGAGLGQAELADGTKDNGAVLQLGGDYKLQINDNVVFKQELSINYSSDNTYTMSLSSLETQLVGSLNLVLAYRIDNNSDVPPGSDTTDTKTTVAVAYKF